MFVASQISKRLASLPHLRDICIHSRTYLVLIKNNLAASVNVSISVCEQCIICYGQVYNICSGVFDLLVMIDALYVIVNLKIILNVNVNIIIDMMRNFDSNNWILCCLWRRKIHYNYKVMKCISSSSMQATLARSLAHRKREREKWDSWVSD